MNKENKLEFLKERLASYETSLKNAVIPAARKSYEESIRRVKREIRKLDSGGVAP